MRIRFSLILLFGVVASWSSLLFADPVITGSFSSGNTQAVFNISDSEGTLSCFAPSFVGATLDTHPTGWAGGCASSSTFWLGLATFVYTGIDASQITSAEVSGTWSTDISTTSFTITMSGYVAPAPDPTPDPTPDPIPAPDPTPDPEPVVFDSVRPDASLGLLENNIAIYRAEDEIIQSCIAAYTDGSLTTLEGGFPQYAITLRLLSLEPIKFWLEDAVEFNPEGLLNSDGELPDCSGRFETTTGLYSDIVQVGEEVGRVTFRFSDVDALELMLETYEAVVAQ